MNKLYLIGNLTSDPEKRATASGVSVTTFTIAVNRRFAAMEGQKQTDFFRINTWRALADTCAKYLAKGRKVAVIGELQARTYEAKDGTTRMSLGVSADEVEFLTPAEAKQEPKQEKPVSEWDDISSDDLPWR